jgi:hypothetical protein
MDPFFAHFGEAANFMKISVYVINLQILLNNSTEKSRCEFDVSHTAHEIAEISEKYFVFRLEKCEEGLKGIVEIVVVELVS